MSPAKATELAHRAILFALGWVAALLAFDVLARAETLAGYATLLALATTGVWVAGLLRTRGTRRVRIGLAVGLLVATAWYAALNLAATYRLPLAGLTLLAALGAVSAPQAARMRVGMASHGGIALGAIAAAAGLAHGTGWVLHVLILVLLLAARHLLGPRIPAGEPPCGHAQTPSVAWARAALAAAVAAAFVGALYGYQPVTRDAAHAIAELGGAFMLGWLAGRPLSSQLGRGGGAVAALSLAVATIVLVNAASFALYPALLFSVPAVAQTATPLLTAGRTFPFWLLSFGLGFAAQSALQPANRALGWPALGVGAVAAAGLWRVGILWPHVLALALLAVCAGAVWAASGGERRASLVLRVAATALPVAGVFWLCLGNVDMNAYGLRLTLGRALGRVGEGGAPLAAGTVTESTRTSDGTWHELQFGEARGQFLGGNLVSLTRGLSVAPMSGLRAGAALAAAVRGEEGRVAVVSPASEEALRAVDTFAPGADVPGGDEPSAVLVPLTVWSTQRRAPGISAERLRDLRDEFGRVVLCVPVGCMEVEDLRRTLATARHAFGDYSVYVFGRVGVVVSGKQPVAYGRLRHLLRHEESRALLEATGYWRPGDLLAGYVGDSGDLAELAAGAEPFRLSGRGRPCNAAWHIAGPLRPAALAGLLQYRLLGPERARAQVTFGSDLERRVSMQSFDGVYRARSTAELEALSRTDGAGRRELVQFLRGPLARLDLLAPDVEQPEVQLAAALGAVGMPRMTSAVLQRTIALGRGTYEVHYYLAGALEEAGRLQDALRHYRRAYELDPDSTQALRRMVDLQIRLGQRGAAVSLLEELVEKEPDSASALLLLAHVYARIGRYERAADTARRVLRIDPENADARALLDLSGEVADDAPENEANDGGSQ